jgi:hypothetical protein
MRQHIFSVSIGQASAMPRYSMSPMLAALNS